MPAFVVADQVEGLEFKLSPYGPDGTIPEPSVGQVEALQKAMAALAGDAAPKDAGELLTHVGTLSDDEQQAIVDGLMAAIADITGAVLTLDQLNALPYRVQRSFVGWLLGSLLLPEASSPATTT